MKNVVGVVMFVMNAVTHDRRVLREASTLAAAGYRVTIIGTSEPGATDVTHDRGDENVAIIRVPVPRRSTLWSPRPSDFAEAWARLWIGRWSGMRAARTIRRVPRWAAKMAIAFGLLMLSLISGGHLPSMLAARARWNAWRRAVLDVTPAAAVYHGHDLTGYASAIDARKRHGGDLVYDSHDLYVEAGSNASRPQLIRQLMKSAERRAYRQADLLITVNASVASEMHRRYGAKQTAIVHNCVPAPPERNLRSGRLRAAAGIPPTSPIILYHGGFTANRGLQLLMRSLLEPGLESAHLVLLGYGPLSGELHQTSKHDEFGGRIHVLPAVPPHQLDAYVAGADVEVMVNQPNSLNEILSTPNKLFESIAAGVPVVTSDFPDRRRIVLEDPLGPLGAVCDPTEPPSIAAAIRGLLEMDVVRTEAMRRRCLAAARMRWNWEHESTALLSAYRALGHAAATIDASTLRRPTLQTGVAPLHGQASRSRQ